MAYQPLLAHILKNNSFTLNLFFGRFLTETQCLAPSMSIIKKWPLQCVIKIFKKDRTL
jgi:hypothetical protein